jgi:hypothetical protein
MLVAVSPALLVVELLPLSLMSPTAASVMSVEPVGTLTTVHVATAGVGSTFPAESVARTANVWSPSPRPW